MRAEHIQHRVDLQGSTRELIKTAYANLIKVGRNNLTTTRIQTRLEAIYEQWQQFDTTHQSIKLALSMADSRTRRAVKKRSYFSKDHYKSTYEIYLETTEMMKELLIEKTAPSTSSSSEPGRETNSRALATLAEPPSSINAGSSTSSQSSPFAPGLPHILPAQTTMMNTHSSYQPHRLPRIDLPKFNGTLAEWLSFKGLFISMVYNNPFVPPVEKLQHLKTSLIGPASLLLKNTDTTDENFQKAWEVVLAFYENERRLVNAALRQLFALKKMTKDSATELEHLYMSFGEVYRTLESLGRPVHCCDDFLVFMAVQRLDPDSVKAWELHLGAARTTPTWNCLKEFIESRLLSLQSFESSQLSSNKQKPQSSARANFVGKTLSCAICSTDHYTYQCEQLTSKTTQQRRDLVKARGLCFNCLGNHTMKNCRSTRRCKKCGQKHHSLLHQHESKSTSSQSEEPQKQVNHAHSIHHQSTTVLLATVKIIISNSHGETKTIWALLDQGSEISLVSESLVQHLSLPRKKSSISIIGVGANQVGKTRGIVILPIRPHFTSSTQLEINAFILPKLTSILPTSQCSLNTKWDHLKNLQLADPQFQTQKQIDLIIGADYYGHLLEGSIIKGPANTPVAQLTKLGWIISGPVHHHQQQNASIHHCSVDQELNSTLEKFWIQEELPTRKQSTLSSEEKLCEEHFLSTHQRDSTGRYIVRLPFKAPPSQLGNSISPSLRALNHLNTKFEQHSNFSTAYSSFIQEYKNLKHMVQAPDQNKEPESVFYLPHHGVIRESSTTTKLRVVFNGSCRSPGGRSLNDILHTGAKLQVDLFDVLLWFRQFRYIFSADIEKMYRQIDVHPDDWNYQRILWKENGKVIKYQLTTVTYGLASAPFLALRAISQLIMDEGVKYPEAVDILTHGRYVDDIFGGSDSIEGLQEKTTQVNNLCMAGGFPLRKWVSNHPDSLLRIPPEHRLTATSVQLQDDAIRALGLFWNPSTDCLHFKFSSTSPTKITKRAVLSKIAQLFDPMGLLSPVFIKLKIFMQELWAVKMQWDDQLPANQLHSWNLLQTLLIGLDNIQIPRWIGMQTSSKTELHGFCDASQSAMAAVIFIRTSTQDKTDVQLVCSKTKVAPLKRMTIPRLELSAAVMLTKLAKHCKQVLNLEDLPCHFWTDSTIVHTWISNHPSKWKDFVHNRVCFIQETVPTAQWHHIAGKINPADCATRGLSAEELKAHSLWWTGPHWLKTPLHNWPTHTNISIPDKQNLEERSATHHVVTTQPWALITRYSSWKKLTRITAMCQRMVSLIMKRSTQPLKSPLTPAEIANATTFLIKYIQNRHFYKEIQALKRKKDLQRNSSLIRLWPFIDNNGVLRVGGRLENSELNFSAKHPCILPRNSHVSTLITRNAHEKTLHGSTRDTLAYLRQQYWIIGGRAPVKSIILKCVTCTRHRRQHAQYVMGQLPPSRVTPSRPFLHSGVDYAGPFLLKTWRGKARLYKAWICVFVCFSTSAVHLEIVGDYTSEAFIAAYKRFIARRGICATLTSDCGTTFKGADGELKKLFTQHSSELQKIASLISSDGTKWVFNPPSAPHFGGKFEAAVKSMKYHLKRLVGETKLTYEQLSTILTQVEAILNSRPLCALTDDPDDLSVLTPGHFLIGHSLCLIPEPNLELLKTSRLSHWQHLTKIIQSFWTIWSKEYLQRHQSMYKWNKSAKPLNKGDLVLVIDERLPPTKWPLGRVIDVHPGRDNIIRVATVKTSTSTFTRPVVKLSPLSVSSSAENSLLGAAKAGGNV